MILGGYSAEEQPHDRQRALIAYLLESNIQDISQIVCFLRRFRAILSCTGFPFPFFFKKE